MKFDIDLHKTFSAMDLTLGDDGIRIRGGYGDLTLVLGYGDNTVVAGSGFTQVYFGDHPKMVYYNDKYTDDEGVVHNESGSYLSHNFDGWGDNYFRGGPGGSFVIAANGSDTLVGSGASDIFHGGNGNNTLMGNGGADYLSVDNGNSKLYGDAGNDWLMAGVGRQLLDGGKGSDDLSGGVGTTFVGGTGADTFHFLADQGLAGSTVVKDFSRGQHDTLDFSTLGRFYYSKGDGDFHQEIDRDSFFFDKQGRLHVVDEERDIDMVVRGLEKMIYNDHTLDLAIARQQVVLYHDFAEGKG